eukprot:s1182_g25.t1
MGMRSRSRQHLPTTSTAFQDKYELAMTSFEQGAYGHEKPKPTTFAHNINGFEGLHGAKSQRDGFDVSWKDRPLQERLQQSATWAEWAPGVKAALIEGMRRQFQRDAGRCHLGAPGNAEEATWDSESDNPKPMHQQLRLCPLSEVALAKWKAHILNDHQPMRRDCRVCDIPLPSLDEAVEEDGLSADVEDVDLPRLESEEPDRHEEVDERTVNKARTNYESWMKLVEECRQVKVKTLTFVEVIPSRNTADVMDGIARIYSRIRSLGLPVLRLHADRAREFTSKAVQRWSTNRDIIPTFTTGSDWKQNGRAEGEINLIKRHTKILMCAHDISEDQWPLLVRHASERRLRYQLGCVGYPVPALLPFNTKVYVKRKSWNQRYAAWRWERSPGHIMGPDPWSSLTSGGYCVQLEDGKYLASSDVIVEHVEPGEDELRDVVVQERVPPGDQRFDEVPHRRLRGKQAGPQLASMELGSNSGEEAWSGVAPEQNLEDRGESARLLKLHAAVTQVLSEECVLVDDVDPEQLACVPSLAMLAHQKFDLEIQLQALDLEKRQKEEEENFLVTKTIPVEQVYKEWDDWKQAMVSEFQSIVLEKKAVRQVPRVQAQQTALEENLKYEELPSKVVFTRKMGGKRKVRACICGNFEDETSAATYAGGCDASQIRCLVRHAALKGWNIHGTDIKCAFLNAERRDRTKLITTTIPYIYVKLGIASHQDVWVCDAAMYGLVTSPRDWAEHRDQVIPGMVWQRDEGDRKWKGSFAKAVDQHLWHLKEECLETGEVHNRGAMAIYVDDVLLAAPDPVAICALQAIAAVWECATPVKATLQEAVSFCGFEIQQNEAERKPTSLEAKIWRWCGELKHAQVLCYGWRLPSPEEEADFTRSENLEMVRRAQACTGALLWLATRTRPELSVGVAAMSRLCTKTPELAVSIGLKMMAYLKRPTLGLVYADGPGPLHGARQQLDKPRCERTVEAYSDISYASTKGYRSVQGQVYFYAGAPVMWNTNRQPFPTQSTAESELVSLCEALVGGRATAALIAALRDEPVEKLVKRLWGDNAASISLATGEGQGSWRTRHLRIRAAILRSALQEEEWQLGHLSGRELVADSFTKVVDGAAFERALQDLCIKGDGEKIKNGGNGRQQSAQARVAMLVGATLLSSATAADVEKGDDELSWLWSVGLILMLVGAVYVGSLGVRCGTWLCSRLRGSSGSQTVDEVKGQEASPQLCMLRCTSSEDEREERAVRRAEANQQSATYVPATDMEELREMLAQSRRIVDDPHNKMHGRTVESWHQDESPQMPRRRKKKTPKEFLESEDEDAAIEQARREMMQKARREMMQKVKDVPNETTSRSRASRSGLSSGIVRSTAGEPSGIVRSTAGEPSSRPRASQSGLSNGIVRSTAGEPSSGIVRSTTGGPTKGYGKATSSRQSSTQSGFCTGAAEMSGLVRSTTGGPSKSSVFAAEASMSSSTRSGSGAGAAEHVPAAAAAAASMSSATQSGLSSAADERRSDLSSNAWNDFQHEYSGRHWGSDRLRAEYWKMKATGKRPK